MSFMCATSMPKFRQCNSLLWVWSRMCLLKFWRSPHPFLFAKNRVLSTLQLWLWKHLLLCSLDYSRWAQPCMAQALFMCTIGFCTCVLPGTWGLERKASAEAPKFLCPSLRSCGAPALSLTQNVCSHTVAHHSAIYNPPITSVWL